jgi:hypothetical protein
MYPRTLTFLPLGLAGALLVSAAPVVGQSPSGGVLTVAQREDMPQGFAIHFIWLDK